MQSRLTSNIAQVDLRFAIQLRLAKTHDSLQHTPVLFLFSQEVKQKLSPSCSPDYLSQLVRMPSHRDKILLSLSHHSWIDRCVPSHPPNVSCTGIEPRTLCVVDKHSGKLPPQFCLCSYFTTFQYIKAEQGGTKSGLNSIMLTSAMSLNSGNSISCFLVVGGDYINVFSLK